MVISWQAAERVKELETLVTWVRQFLCTTNPMLGREGHVCPFTESAIAFDTLFVKIDNSVRISVPELQALIIDLKLTFRNIQVGQELFKCLILALPSLRNEDHINVETVQSKVKRLFVQDELMVGQFHPLCAEPGLWSRKFRPLQSPIALLAIRNMALSDIAFLHHDDAMVRNYLSKFGKRGERNLAKFLEKARAE